MGKQWEHFPVTALHMLLLMFSSFKKKKKKVVTAAFLLLLVRRMLQSGIKINLFLAALRAQIDYDHNQFQ